MRTRAVKRRHEKRNAPALTWLGLLLAAYLCAPLLACLPQIGLADWRGMDGATLLRALWTSVASASLATCAIALGGIPLGYLLARSRSRRMAFLGFLVQLPLALPPLASGVLLLFLMGPYSPLGSLLGGVLGELTDTFGGIVLAQVFVAAPFLIIAARSGFGALDAGLEDVAATLGHGAWRRFTSVALPLAWPALRAGLLLSWLRAFGEFGATMMVAYHPYSLPVYTYVAFGAQGLPAMLPLLVPTLAIAVGVALFAAARPRPPAYPSDGEAPLVQPSLLVPLDAARAAALLPVWPPNGASSGGISGGMSGDLSSDIPGDTSGGISSGAPAHLQLRIRQRIGSFTLDLDWQAGARRLAIVGPSGSGKSLTLRLIAGLHADADDAAECTVALGAKVLSSLPASARALAYVPQDYGLFPHLTLAEQLAFPVGAQPESARAWLAHLGLAGLEQRKPAALSLGQRQRVALARALVRPCRLILLDEPFSALDTPRRRQLRQTLRAVQNEIDATTILVTHDPDEAALLADEILVLDKGRVLQVGPTAALFERPANLQVAALLGIENIGRGIYPGHQDAGPALDPPGHDGMIELELTGGLRLAARARPASHAGDHAGIETGISTGNPTFTPGCAVLWRIPRRAVTPAANGRYIVRVLDSTRQAGNPVLNVDFGGTLLHLSPLPGNVDVAPGTALRVAIDPDLVEVWREQH